uniref:Uncharacterized protein n=1 Tax=Acrobeloides nanus TaxID=290746 RepID=A0A914DL64_9BILA
MQTFGVFVIFVIGLTSAFPSLWKRQASENSAQADDASSNWPSVSFRFDLKFSKLRKFYVHLIKSYVDVDIITTFFQLPASEQQCILNAWDNISNSDSYQTPNQTAAEVVNLLKAACPNSASTIQVLVDKITAEKDRYAQQYMNFINTMPQSIKDADAKLWNALQIMNANNGYQNITALKTVLLPALESLKQIPSADVQTLANSAPFLAPILTGNKSESLSILIQAPIDMINNGNVTNEAQVKQAWQDIMQYLKDEFKQFLSDIDHHTEASLPANVDQALQQTIGNQIAKSFQQLAKIPFLTVNIDENNDVYEISV